MYEITIKFIKLNEFRKIFNLKPNFNSSPIFKEILIKSKDIVSNWGGKIYFVIIPDLDYANYINNNKKNSYIWQKNLDYINNTVKELNIPIINLHKNVIDINTDPISLFSLRIGSHYNNEGYKLITEEIYKTVSKELID